MLKDLSPIQNEILSKLKNAQSLRYGQLQKREIPNDLFNYHLQYLVKNDFIIKSTDGYVLSDKGIRHIADPYTTNNSITSLFKINVITILSRIKDGEIQILNQIRKSHPSFGKVGVIYGVVLKGELIEQAASRKLKIETGLDAQFKVIGCERRIMYKSNDLFSDLMFPIAYANVSTGKLITETNFGHNMWVSLDKAIINESAEFDSIRSINIVLKAIKNNNINTLPFFFKEEIQSDNLNNN